MICPLVVPVDSLSLKVLDMIINSMKKTVYSQILKHLSMIKYTAITLLLISFFGCDESSSSEPSGMMNRAPSPSEPDPRDESRPSAVVEPPPAVCGDQVRAGEEECDDGNAVEGDGCDSNCLIERCGNGVVQFAERCDDGAENSDVSPNRCRLNCTFPRCGDGVQDQREECDDGNLNNFDACRSSCLLALCGDGLLREDLEESDPLYETCDHGSLNSDTRANACRTDCQWAGCGDGIQDAGEECDLGAQNSSLRGSGASCRSDCRLPRCGDGVNDQRPECDSLPTNDPPTTCGNGRLDVGEACDQGEANTNDPAVGAYDSEHITCRTDCQFARCGDGILDLEERCDDGNIEVEPCVYGEESCMVCGSECLFIQSNDTSYCGDGEIDPSEQCDSLPTDNQTFCDSSCRFLDINCGDGDLDPNEECDDNNVLDGDGCSFECLSECSNGILDLGEVCDNGALNQIETCDLACTLGRVLIKRGMTEHQGAIPVTTYNENGTAEYSENDNISLYHDEYIFQNDGASTLSVCFDFITDEEETEDQDPESQQMFSSLFKVSLEKINSLAEDADIQLNFIDNTQGVVTDLIPNSDGCILFTDTYLDTSGAYRLKVSLQNLNSLTEETRETLRTREVLRRLDKEVHYGLDFKLYRAINQEGVNHGRVGSQGDDLYLLSLDEDAKVSLRLTTDHFGRCPLEEGTARPRLTVYNKSLDGNVGSERAIEMRLEEQDRQACSMILGSNDWLAGEYWIKVDTETPSSPSGRYRLDSNIRVSDFERSPFPPRQVILFSSEFIDHLPERRAADPLSSLRALARRYIIEVPESDEEATEKGYELEATMFGCESGALTQVELWSLDEDDDNSVFIHQAVELDESDPHWAQGACQRLRTFLEPGRYSITLRHSELESVSGLTVDEIIARSSFPYLISIHHGNDLKRGGGVNGRIGVTELRDLPVDQSTMQRFIYGEESAITEIERLGFITGIDRFTLLLDQREEVSLDLSVASACELLYNQGTLEVDFDLWLQLDGEAEPVSLRADIGEDTEEALEVFARNSQLSDCGGQIRLSIPSGSHSIYVNVKIENDSLASPLSSDQISSISLPHYTLTLERPELCGNGQTEGVEECDDGNLDANDYCDQCKLQAVCGDGIQEESLDESCDDGNLIPFDGCSPSCYQCGDQVKSAGEECEYTLDSADCDEYCTQRIYDVQTSESTYTERAISVGESDQFNIQLREYSWLAIETLGCESEDPNLPRRFDTKLELTRDEDNHVFEASDDQETSACAKLEQYIDRDEGGQATLEVKSERFDTVLGYSLDITQSVRLLSDRNGLCVRRPISNQNQTPIDLCPENSHTLPELKGTLSGEVNDQHRFYIDSRRENYLGFKVSRLNQSSCPRHMYVVGFMDEDGNPIRIDFDSENDETTCAVLPKRSWPEGRYSLYLETDVSNHSGGDFEYKLEAEIPEATLSTCGNYQLEIGEECDVAADGTVLGGDSNQGICRECRLPYCGDGFAERDEVCDNGVLNADDQSCLSNCQIALCGDRYIRTDLGAGEEGYEECDEGDQNADDQSCLSDCLSARCGDGFTRIDLVEGEPGYERCDDGNNEDGDGCSADCTAQEQLCSDGSYIPEGETCPEPPLIPVCGNAFTELNETCDDGNQLNGDGCDSSCQSERVYVKSGLYNEISDGIHLYEISVDGLSRLVVETEGAGSLCENGVQDPTLPEIDTTITVYDVADDGRLSQVIINNDDHPILNSKCSKVDLQLYEAGRYIIEVGAYGNEPLVPYRLKLQLSRDLSRGLPLEGQLSQGETDVYSISLYDLQSKEITIDTLRAFSDLKVEFIHVGRDEVLDPFINPNQPNHSASFPIDVTLESELGEDLFGSGDEPGEARSILDRVFVLVHRDTEILGLRRYAIGLTRLCGDGVLNYGGSQRYVENGEQCDDGNTNDGDGCSSWCRLERNLCGNGITETYIKDGVTIEETCDSGHLLADPQIPPDFAHPDQVENSEMTYSVMLYFREPIGEDENTREYSFTIDTRAIHYVGIDPSSQKTASFRIDEDEADLANLAQRINDSFPNLISAWGRGDELSLIIKGGRSSSQVVITLPYQGPWKQSDLQPLCDQSCTPIRKRLVSNDYGQGDYVDYKKIDGKVEEEQEDVYFLELDGDHTLSVLTTGCRYRTATESGIDTSLSLYRLDHGEKISLMAQSDDIGDPEPPGDASRFCSHLNEIELTQGSYALYVSGYLESSLESYSLYYKLVRDNINLGPNTGTTVQLGPEILIYDEFSDEFDTRLHSLSIAQQGVGQQGVKLFTQLPELCGPEGDFPVNLRPKIQLDYAQGQVVVNLCTEDPATQTFGDSPLTKMSLNFISENDVLTPASKKAYDLLKKMGYIPLSYQYCFDSTECVLNKCGNGIVDRGDNVADEDCDDGNNTDDDFCTNLCKFNSYDVVERISPVPPLDVNIQWNSLPLGDDQVIAFKIPDNKTFRYFNRSYNAINVSSNGFITLFNTVEEPSQTPTSRGNGCCSGGNIPFSRPSRALIAPYWEDLLGQNSYRAKGQNRWTLDNNTLIIEWKDVEHYGYRSELNVTAQVILGLDNGTIELRCENCQSDGGLHTQGLRGPYSYQGVANPSLVRRSWSAISEGIKYEPTITQ